MSSLIATHHDLELELYRLRLLRDLGSPQYHAEAEEAVLDEMEALWYRLPEDDRRILEAQRAGGLLFKDLAQLRPSTLPAVDVGEHQRLSLPPRLSIDAA